MVDEKKKRLLRMGRKDLASLRRKKLAKLKEKKEVECACCRDECECR